MVYAHTLDFKTPIHKLDYLDYWTQIALDAIWKEQVQECIANDNETGITDDWELIEQTPFTEPFWGIVVNK
jgi:hypothetical protein